MYNNKVVICGVDTSKLPLLKEKEKEALLKQVKAGDNLAREKLINGNLRLVLSVIQRFADGRYGKTAFLGYITDRDSHGSASFLHRRGSGMIYLYYT